MNLEQPNSHWTTCRICPNFPQVLSTQPTRFAVINRAERPNSTNCMAARTRCRCCEAGGDGCLPGSGTKSVRQWVVIRRSISDGSVTAQRDGYVAKYTPRRWRLLFQSVKRCIRCFQTSRQRTALPIGRQLFIRPHLKRSRYVNFRLTPPNASAYSDSDRDDPWFDHWHRGESW